MALSNCFIPNDYDIFVNNLGNVSNHVNNIYVDNINGTPYNPLPSPLPTPIPNKFLRTTNNVSPSLFWGDVTPGELVHGSANQLLSTNSLGTASEWRSNITIPGTLIVNSSSVFNDNALFNQDCAVTGDSNLNNVDITGNLTINGTSGTPGYILTKTGPTSQNWVINPTVRCIRYTKFFDAQNLNLVGPSALIFDLAAVQADFATGTSAAVSGFTQLNNTTFRAGYTAVYDIDFSIYIDPSSAGLGNSVITISVEVAGSEQSYSCLTNGATNHISGKIPSVLLTAAQNIRILTRRVVGANALNTFGASSLAPNFASNITFTLVRIVQ